MMAAAIRDPNPVVYLYPAGLRELMEEVPDEQYETPLDKAARAHGRRRHHHRRFRRRHARGAEGGRRCSEAGNEGRGHRPAQPQADGYRDAGQVGAEDQAPAHRRPVVLHALPGRGSDRARGGERRRRALQARGLPRRAAARRAGDVPVDAAQRRTTSSPRRRNWSADGCRPAAAVRYTCTSCGSVRRCAQAHVRSAFWQDERLVVVEEIPALVCGACAEQFYDDSTVVGLDLLRGEGFPAEKARARMRVPVFSFADRAAGRRAP